MRGGWLGGWGVAGRGGGVFFCVLFLGSMFYKISDLKEVFYQ